MGIKIGKYFFQPGIVLRCVQQQAKVRKVGLIPKKHLGKAVRAVCEDVMENVPGVRVFYFLIDTLGSATLKEAVGKGELIARDNVEFG